MNYKCPFNNITICSKSASLASHDADVTLNVIVDTAIDEHQLRLHASHASNRYVVDRLSVQDQTAGREAARRYRKAPVVIYVDQGGGKPVGAGVAGLPA
jgi:hypothetical protein